jgi:hypothetical protein
VPVQNFEAVREWGELHDPSYRLFAAVEEWTQRLEDDAALYPSVPCSFDEGDPTETRWAELANIVGVSVNVFYEVAHESRLVTVLYVGP